MKIIRDILIISSLGFFVQDIQSAMGIPLRDTSNCLQYGFHSRYGKIGLGLLGCSAVAMRYGVCPDIYAQITTLIGCASYMYGIYEGIKTVRSVIARYLLNCDPEIICSCEKANIFAVFYGRPDAQYNKTNIWIRNYNIGPYTTIPIAARDDYCLTMNHDSINIDGKLYVVGSCSHP